MQLCCAMGLYIVNGRLRGDSFGRYTYSSSLGSSTVDYAITDLDPVSLRAFTVKPLTHLSDQSQIIVYLKKTETNNIPAQPSKLDKCKQQYRWARISIVNQSLLDSLLVYEYPHNKEGINLAVNHINHIFDNVAYTVGAILI